MANQFTKGTRTEHDEPTKDRIRAELLSQRYYKYAMATGKRAHKMGLTPAQVASAKMLIDKGKPSLQAIEQKTVSELEGKSEDEIVALVNALITSNPGLIAKLGIGLRPVAEQQIEPKAVQQG